MNKYYFVTVFVLPLIFCQHTNNPELNQDTDVPGYFSLTHLQGLQKTETIMADTNTINLGNLHSTTNYYFLLTNCGGHVITHINLSVSDSSFTIFPTSIDSLTVGLGTQALVPIIKLTAIHGTGAQGLGSAPLMPPGNHQVHINITGTTSHNNTDTSIFLTAVATVNSLIMDIDMHTSTSFIDLSAPTSGLIGTMQFDGYDVVNIRGYNTKDSADNMVTIINNGNIGIKIKTISRSTWDDSFVDSSSCSVNVNDSASFNIILGCCVYFRLDGSNTICDQTRLRLQSDGKAYFLFFRP